MSIGYHFEIGIFHFFNHPAIGDPFPKNGRPRPELHGLGPLGAQLSADDHLNALGAVLHDEPGQISVDFRGKIITGKTWVFTIKNRG